MRQLPPAQLLARFINDATLVANTELFDSRGLPNRFDLARDYDGKEGAAYLHNGSVRTLTDLLTPPEQRPRRFYTGSNLYNPRQLGLEDAGPFVYDTSEPGKGAQGHAYGTDLPAGQKRALLEYLKSLCSPGLPA